MPIRTSGNTPHKSASTTSRGRISADKMVDAMIASPGQRSGSRFGDAYYLGGQTNRSATQQSARLDTACLR